ncbi:MAG TPA: gamma-glutamyltransferase [Solirubrobacteraceae bacterium]|jgi:gamma-glutamyltranspeptidase / glutathione hydrolase|nr:gamma-glutamyltransferase [Solirubrobacteraceae bacterium]
MFWLDERHPNGIAPGKRPRTTLSPTLVLRDGAPETAFGTPGGDAQDQWSLQFFLARESGMQAAMDQPKFTGDHAPSSFYPRAARPGSVDAEARLGGDDAPYSASPTGSRDVPTTPKTRPGTWAE